MKSRVHQSLKLSVFFIALCTCVAGVSRPIRIHWIVSLDGWAQPYRVVRHTFCEVSTIKAADTPSAASASPVARIELREPHTDWIAVERYRLSQLDSRHELLISLHRKIAHRSTDDPDLHVLA
jgi:hypothetical protein